MTPQEKDLRETIALEILKARIQNHGVSFSDDHEGTTGAENVRMHVNDAFFYADEFMKQSNSVTEPYDWDGSEKDRAINRK